MTHNDSNDAMTLKSYLLLALIGMVALWQMGVLIIGLLLAVILRGCQLNTKKLGSIGLLCVVISLCLDVYFLHYDISITGFIKQGFHRNALFFKLLTHSHSKLAFYYQLKFLWPYILGFSWPLAWLVQSIDQAFASPHAKALRQMAKAKLEPKKRIPPKRLQRKLLRLSNKKNKNNGDNKSKKEKEGTFIGISLTSFQPCIIPDHLVNQIVLVLGTTGAGKTVTLSHFYRYAIQKKYPLIIVDGKPTDEMIHFIQRLAQDNQRSFYGFNCGNYAHYNVLAYGGFTELKDKIMTLKDKWENDYYRSVSEDYLQTTLEVLLKAGIPVDLKEVSRCLDLNHLVGYCRQVNEVELNEKVAALKRYDSAALTGLQAHINALIHSELGRFFLAAENSFNIQKIIETKGVVYFALPSLKFPDFSKMLGKVVINDIKTAIEPLALNTPIYTVFDEFSVFVGDQVMNLVNMGRGKGLHTIFGTQGLGDLKEISSEFERKLLNCINTLICHRVNDHETAESVSEWVGTQLTYDVTAQIDLKASQANLGSASRNRAFHIHPDEIKQELQAGEAFFVSKVGQFCVDKIKVKL